jgi:TatD DNase family protein
MFVDSHCHVHFRAYKDEQDALIKKTLESGVFMVTVGTDHITSQEAILCAEKYDGVFATVGLHPEHVIDQTFFDENESSEHFPAEVFDPVFYRTLSQSKKCVAIGECGLDYYRIPEGTDRDMAITKQKQTVRAHFDLAHELDLPVVVHCRDAYEDQLLINQEYLDAGKLSRRGVIHCFAGTLEQARAFVAQGFYLGFTGVITFPARKIDVLMDGLTETQQIIREIPMDRILIETDAPYLTPIPFRGKRNEPAYVKYVAEKIAEIKQVSLEEIENTTTKNAKRLFQFGIE